MAAYNVWQASPDSGRLANSGSRGGFRRKDIFDMEITGIKNIHPAASKASSRKGWKLTDSLREKITALAREDAAQGVYMGNQFLALRKSEVAKVAPDRAGILGFPADWRIGEQGGFLISG